MQGAARRLLICGMHVHVGIDDDELRIDLMNQMSYFLPHLLALSCSSPFWNGRDTGLKSYRLTIFDALPRTGLAGTICQLRGISAARQYPDGGRPDRGLDADLVGPAAERSIPDARDAHHGRVHASGRHGSACCAAGVHHAHAVSTAHAQPALASSTRRC